MDDKEDRYTRDFYNGDLNKQINDYLLGNTSEMGGELKSAIKTFQNKQLKGQLRKNRYSTGGEHDGK